MKNDNVIIENAFVSYIDVLGFRARFASTDFTRKYERLIETISGIRDEGLSLFLLSDSIVIVSEDFELVKRQTRDFYTWGVLNDFWIRGGIARGNVTRYKEVTERNKIIFPFLGQGYLNAYKLESGLNMSGVSIDEDIFTNEADPAALREELDYVEYEEHLPKRGYEGKKRLLLPRDRSIKQIINGMHFEEMLKSHVEDIDKYINTFCFHVTFLVQHADAATLETFQEKLLRELDLHGRRVLIPSKVVIIFVAVIEALFNRYRSGKDRRLATTRLETYVSSIVAALKEQGHLSAFVDYLLDYDKRRHTSLYKDINSLRADSTQQINA